MLTVGHGDVLHAIPPVQELAYGHVLELWREMWSTTVQ